MLSPGHARLLGAAGWSKADVRQADVRARRPVLRLRDRLRSVLTSPEAVLVVVAGAGNAGLSAVVEPFGPRGGPPPVVRVT